MEFRILGPLEVVAGDEPIQLGGPKQRAVLAHLILRANHPVHADRLIDGLWGDEPPDTARNTLQTYVYRLRKVLGEDRLTGSDGGYVLNAEAGEIDSARFEAIVREAKSLVSADPETAAARFSDALALWRGSPLADLADEPSLQGEVARLEELHVSAIEHRIAAEIATGGHSTVVSELEALTARYPLRERMWANLMLALYHAGRQAEALSTYERAREVLSNELGTDPSGQLQQLHERILRRDPALDPTEPSRPPTVRPSRIDLPAGTEFASYRIERPLGRGGMSVVYLAQHEWLQRKVALKVLAPQLAEDERFRERFIRESRLAASLDHPNVIPIYEAGASGGDLFIAMRYVEGSDLRTLLQQDGALGPSRAIAIVRQVASALDAAHEQGLVHRDVKPGNVLLARARSDDETEHVYLSDFGLTKRSASDSGVTGTGQFVGTLDYAAPEQFQGGTPDARTDVYSLGCVLFECLTGRPPFAGDNDAALMYAHLQEQPPAVTAIAHDLPREVDHVVATAMAKAPADRYPSAGVLAREASRALGLGTTQGGGAEPRSPLRRLVPALAAAVALVVGVLVASLFQGDSPLPQADGSPPPSTASPSPTVPPTFRTIDRSLSDDEDLLLTFIPDAVRGECLPLDRPEPLHGERASLVCRTEDVEVLYQLFQTRAEMDAAFEVNVNNQRAPEGDCSTESLAVGSYTVGGMAAGSVLCWTIERATGTPFNTASPPDQSHIEWTDENASIYGHAVRNDLADLSLYNWWLTSSGPIPPDVEDPVADKDPPAGTSTTALQDGSYLTFPSDGCAGFRGETCAMHIRGDTYEQIFTEFPDDVNEAGSILLQKPNSVLFSMDRGFCTLPEAIGGGDDARPAAYTWSGGPDAITFERIRGGRCVGPQKLGGPWTLAPDGLIAIERDGEIELRTPGGTVVGSTTQTNTAPNTWPDWSPDGSRIVYAGAGARGFDLYVMNEEGSERRSVTDAVGDEYSPAWSPDGSRIAFAFDDLGDPAYRSGIAIVAPDGSGSTELMARENERVEMPIWSPDGSRIAFTVFSADGIVPYVMDADGSDVTRLREGPGVALDWMPGGRRILLGADTRFVSVRPDGTGERVFLEEPPEGGRLVVDWSPDGEWIVMSTPHAVGTPSGPATGNVYLMRADGSQLFHVGLGSEPSWRPEAG